MLDLNAKPEGLKFPTHLLSVPVDDETAGNLLEMLWVDIVKGDNTVLFGVEQIEDEVEGVDSEEAASAVKYLFDARRAQQAAFGDLAPTKLETAFQALREAKIVAEMDFSCCGNCGASEIGGDEAEAGELDQWLGYVFFHTQDTEGLIEARNTYLNYGIFWPAHVTEDEFKAMGDAERERVYTEKTLALMKEVVIPILESHGIKVVWDGSMRTRILLEDVDWYMPFPAENDEEGLDED